MQTKDYYQFKMPLHGRQINQDVIAYIVNFVNRGNAKKGEQPQDGRMRRLVLVSLELETHPILVDKSMNVIEGKHKLEIARQLDLPVSYVIKGDE